MTSKKVLILSLAAILAIAAGLWVAGRQSSPGNAHGLLYPQLKQQLGAISAVRLFEAHEDGETLAVELKRQDDPGTASQGAMDTRPDDAPAPDARWGVGQRAGYPVDGAKLRKLLLSIAEAKITEEKTSDPERYARLGVQDLDAADAEGVRIQTDPPHVNLIVGKRGVGTQSNYVRRAGEPQSWLIDAALDAPTTPEDWLHKDLLDVSADRIQSAAVTLQGARTYTASKAARADADFKIEGLPRGKQLSSSTAANSTATALVGLKLDDVQPAATFEAGAADAHAEFKTFDGLIVALDGWQHEDRHFIAARISFDPEQAGRFVPMGVPDSGASEAGQAQTSAQTSARTSDAASDPTQEDSVRSAADAAPKADAGATAGADRGTPADDPAGNGEVAREAQALHARLAAWVYEIPDYKYESIFKPVENLLAN